MKKVVDPCCKRKPRVDPWCKRNPWYKCRGYAHFDAPVERESAKKLVSDPPKVASHPFYPFLQYAVVTQKIEKDKTTKRVLQKPAKERKIAYAAHLDSHIYSYYAFLLSQLYETRLKELDIDDSVLAFRSLGKSNIDCANDAFDLIRKYGDCVVYATDISGFFDNLDHKILKGMWASLLGQEKLPDDHYAVYKSITKYSYVSRDDAFKVLGISKNNPPCSGQRFCSVADFREKIRAAELIKPNSETKGIPQGSPISALLSNIYLLEFDKQLHDEISAYGGRYLRYCDDILCMVPMSYESSIRSRVKGLIEDFKLTINETKTSTVLFSDSSGTLQVTGGTQSNGKKPRHLQYLGFTFDGQRKLIRSAAFAKFSAKMRRGVSLAKQTARKHNKMRIASGQVREGIWRTKLYNRYSHLGRQNFVRYGLRAAEKMESNHIRRQLKPLWSRLAERIEKENDDLHNP